VLLSLVLVLVPVEVICLVLLILLVVGILLFVVFLILFLVVVVIVHVAHLFVLLCFMYLLRHVVEFLKVYPLTCFDCLVINVQGQFLDFFEFFLKIIFVQNLGPFKILLPMLLLLLLMTSSLIHY
jgi:hypothetical protein